MTKDPYLVFMEEVTEIGDKLKAAEAELTEVIGRKYYLSFLFFFDSTRPRRGIPNHRKIRDSRIDDLTSRIADMTSQDNYLTSRINDLTSRINDLTSRINDLTSLLTEVHCRFLTSLVGEEGQRLCIGGRRVADAIVVSAVVLLSFVYLYLIGYIDRGGSKAGSSGSLDFRDVYISIVLFQAAYVWIKFRDVIPRGAVFHRRDSNKFEPRIKFPRGVGGNSKRIPLGSYGTFAEAEVVYLIAAFYCDKPQHTGRLDLGGGAYFPIPALSVDPHLPYERKVKEVRNEVWKVYAEFEQRKASRNLPPSVRGLAFETPNEEGHLLATSLSQQLRQPLNSGMDSAMQGQGSQLGPNTHNGVDFNNSGCLLRLLAETQHKLLDARQQNECLKDQVSRTEVENMGWDLKCSELEQRNVVLERRNSELEHERGLLNHQIMQLQSQLQTQHQEQEFDTDRFLSVEHEESLAR